MQLSEFPRCLRFLGGFVLLPHLPSTPLTCRQQWHLCDSSLHLYPAWPSSAQQSVQWMCAGSLRVIQLYINTTSCFLRPRKCSHLWGSSFLYLISSLLILLDGQIRFSPSHLLIDAWTEFSLKPCDLGTEIFCWPMCLYLNIRCFSSRGLPSSGEQLTFHWRDGELKAVMGR